MVVEWKNLLFVIVIILKIKRSVKANCVTMSSLCYIPMYIFISTYFISLVVVKIFLFFYFIFIFYLDLNFRYMHLLRVWLLLMIFKLLPLLLLWWCLRSIWLCYVSFCLVLYFYFTTYLLLGSHIFWKFTITNIVINFNANALRHELMHKKLGFYHKNIYSSCLKLVTSNVSCKF